MTAISNLYSTFAAYPLNPGMDACPCCVDAEDKHQVSAKPLRELTGDDLSNYAFKAVSTWGSVEDFKHFLPRILELLANNELTTDLFVVIRKLSYTSWETWPENERQAVSDFLFSWWEAQHWEDSYQPREAFLELHTLTGQTRKLLDLWKPGLNTPGFAGLVNLIYHELGDISGQQRDFKHFSEQDSRLILHWIFSQKALLEEGFFHFGQSDPAFAKQISDALYIVEQHRLILDRHG